MNTNPTQLSLLGMTRLSPMGVVVSNAALDAHAHYASRLNPKGAAPRRTKQSTRDALAAKLRAAGLVTSDKPTDYEILTALDTLKADTQDAALFRKVQRATS